MRCYGEKLVDYPYFQKTVLYEGQSVMSADAVAVHMAGLRERPGHPVLRGSGQRHLEADTSHSQEEVD